MVRVALECGFRFVVRIARPWAQSFVASKGTHMISEEIERQELAVCRELVVRLMEGTRDGSDRPWWRHAEDVAEAVLGYGWIHPEGWMFWGCVAWMHDLLEDCDGLTDEKLVQELVAGGVLPFRATELVRMVGILTKTKGEGGEYFQRIRDCGQWQLSLIKILDRLANLREGRPVFSESRWAGYVEETRQHILPLVAIVDADLRERLLVELEAAMEERR